MLEIRRLTPAELGAFVELNGYAFHWDERTRERVQSLMVPEQTWGAVVDGQLAAGLWSIPMTTWMHGRRIPMMGIANVAVAPEHRGRGLGRLLLGQALAEMKESGHCTSTLYPSTYTFYRRFGWEFGAEDRAYTFRPADLAEVAARAPAGGRMQRCTAADAALLDPIYRAFAAGRNGWVERTPDLWTRRVLRLGIDQHAYIWLGPSGSPRGYLIYGLKGEDMLKQTMTVREWVALDPEAFAGIAEFIAQHNTVAEVKWTAPTGDPLLTLLPDPRIDTRVLPRHMFRVVEIGAAVRRRYFPAGLAAQIHLTIRDGAAPWNQGTYRLRVAGGEGEALPEGGPVAAAGTGAAGFAAEGLLALACDINTFSQIYCGYLSPSTAVQLGRLQVSGPDAAALADALFTVAPPHMSDYF